MRVKLLLVTVFIAAPLPAQNSSVPACPWLTEGSAAKVLGAEVRVAVKVTNATQGTCTFVSTANRQDQLKVFVGTKEVPSCPSGSARVTGIGDEASQCRLRPSARGAAQMISGKVRAVEMAVTLSTRGTRNEDAIEQIAEQVAGNLF